MHSACFNVPVIVAIYDMKEYTKRAAVLSLNSIIEILTKWSQGWKHYSTPLTSKDFLWRASKRSLLFMLHLNKHIKKKKKKERTVPKLWKKYAFSRRKKKEQVQKKPSLFRLSSLSHPSKDLRKIMAETKHCQMNTAAFHLIWMFRWWMKRSIIAQPQLGKALCLLLRILTKKLHN